MRTVLSIKKRGVFEVSSTQCSTVMLLKLELSVVPSAKVQAFCWKYCEAMSL